MPSNNDSYSIHILVIRKSICYFQHNVKMQAINFYRFYENHNNPKNVDFMSQKFFIFKSRLSFKIFILYAKKGYTNRK